MHLPRSGTSRARSVALWLGRVPVSYSSHSENPDNAEAYFQYPLLRLESTELPPQLRQYDKGRRFQPVSECPAALFTPPATAHAGDGQVHPESCVPCRQLSNGWRNRICRTWPRPCAWTPWPNQHGWPSRSAMTSDGHPSKRPSLAFTTSRRV